MRYIYKIQFPNNKCYIGQTKNIKQRMQGYKTLHCKDMPRMYYALKKYGFGSCSVEILCECGDLEADYLEKKYIKDYNTTDGQFGYNLDSGGCKIKNHSNDTCIKIGKSIKLNNLVFDTHTKRIKSRKNNGKPWHSRETIQKIINANKGRKRKPLALEHKNKISNSTEGMKKSKETRKKMSNSKKGIPRLEETKNKIKESCSGEKSPCAIKYIIQAPENKILEIVNRRNVRKKLGCSDYFFSSKRFKEYILLNFVKINKKL